MQRKQMSAVVLGLAWMASLGVVFILGILLTFTFHLGPGATSGGASDLSLEQRELMLVIERYTGEAADMGSIMSVASSESLPEQIEQALRAIMRESDREDRQMAAKLLVRGLPSRKVMAAIKSVQEIPTDPGRDQVLGCLLESWAAEDGRRAIAFATSMKAAAERELAIRSVLRGWSQVQPAQAWAWVMEQSGPSRRVERWLEIVVSSLSVADRATAFNLLERMPSSEFQDQMSLVVMEQLLQTETPRDAMAWLSEFPANSQSYAATYLAENWALTEPSAAATWLHEVYPQEIAGLGDVLREWVYSSPEQAAEWVWRSFGGPRRRQLMDVVSAEWVGNAGPSPLAEWLNTHGPDPTLDGAIEQLALSTASMDPATALVWAQSIYDPDMRSMLEIMIGREWIRVAPDSAAESLPLLLDSESARAALLEPAEEEGYYIEEDTGIVEEALPLEEAPVQ